jgi:hypothetical protein
MDSMDSEVKVDKDETPVVSMTPARRRPAARKSASASPRTRKAAPRRKTASARLARRTRRKAAPRMSFEGVIRSITGGVSVARAAIAEASGQGATAVRRAVGSASRASRTTVKRLANEWKHMDPKTKARVLAALLGAAAAASAPLVRKTLKK